MCRKTYSFCLFAVVSSTLSLSYSSRAFMSSPTRLHPTGTEEQQKFRHLPQEPGRTRPVLLLLLLFWLSAGYRPAIEEIESTRSETLLRGHGNGLAWLWGRIGRGREGCRTDKVGGDDESPSPTPIYCELLSAHLSVLKSDPKLPLSCS